MLAVVSADLVARMLLGKDSVFTVLLLLSKSQIQEEEEREQREDQEEGLEQEFRSKE
jgi:hypothetical protein